MGERVLDHVTEERVEPEHDASTVLASGKSDGFVNPPNEDAGDTDGVTTNPQASAPRIALFSSGASPNDVESLGRLITTTCPELKVVQWPDGQSFTASALWFRAGVLVGSSGSTIEAELAARPSNLPLLAIGDHDGTRAKPSCWIRHPSPVVLAAVLRAMLRETDSTHAIEHRTDDDLAGHLFAPPIIAYRDAKARFENAYYSRLLRLSGGNISLAAKLAHKTRKEVYDAMKRLGLKLVEYRGRVNES